MQKIAVCLWFDDQAEEAVNFYLSIFKKSKLVGVARYGDSGAKIAGKAKGSVMTVSFQIEGQDFLALNGGPIFTFSPAISLIVNCQSQEELDEHWEKLSAGGEKGQCGWLKDKFGVSWQIVPSELGELMQTKDPKKAEKIMAAMLQMGKLDIDKLKHAAEE